MAQQVSRLVSFEKAFLVSPFTPKFSFLFPLLRLVVVDSLASHNRTKFYYENEVPLGQDDTRETEAEANEKANHVRLDGGE